MSRPECPPPCGNTTDWIDAGWTEETGFRGTCGVCGTEVTATERLDLRRGFRTVGTLQIARPGRGGTSVNVTGSGNTVVVNGGRRRS